MYNLRLQELSPNKRTPLIGNFELTRKCPLDCVICYNAQKNRDEMSTTEIMRLLGELAEMGCLYVNFTGGEPLLHKDFCEIYEHAVLLGIKPSIESNALLLTQKHVDLLKKYPPEHFQVSLYAIDDDIYMQTTRSNYKFSDILEKLQLLKEHKISYSIRTPISKLNFMNLGKLHDFCKSINIPFEFNIKVFWKQSGDRLFNMRCSSEDIKPLINQHKVYKQAYDMLIKIENEPINRRDCYTGIYDFNINAYCELDFCITYWMPNYDLRKGTISDAWNNWYIHYRKIDDNFCIAKKIVDGCNGYCPWGYLYKNVDEDCSIDLDIMVKNKIQKLLSKGLSIESIANHLSISKDDAIYFTKQ